MMCYIIFLIFSFETIGEKPAYKERLSVILATRLLSDETIICAQKPETICQVR